MNSVFLIYITRFLRVISVILISSLAFAEEPKIKPEGANVIIYEHINFLGDAKALKVGAHNLKDLGIFWNDRISSIYVPEGYVVYLFEHENFQGRYVVAGRQGRSWVGYKATLPDLTVPIYTEQVNGKPFDSSSYVWNDRISSLIIYRSEAAIPEVKLYLTLRPESKVTRCVTYDRVLCREYLLDTGNAFSELNVRPFPFYQPPKLAYVTPENANEVTPPANTLYWDGSPGKIDMLANAFFMEIPDITKFGSMGSEDSSGSRYVNGVQFLSSETGQLKHPEHTVFNDNLRAIKLCSGCTLTIYQDINFGGRSIRFTGPIEKDLFDEKFWVLGNRSNWGHRMSSFKVTFPPPPKAK